MRRLIRQFVRVKTVAVLVVAWLAGALGLGLATDAGAVPTVALMALGPLLGGLATVGDAVARRRSRGAVRAGAGTTGRISGYGGSGPV